MEHPAVPLLRSWLSAEQRAEFDRALEPGLGLLEAVPGAGKTEILASCAIRASLDGGVRRVRIFSFMRSSTDKAPCPTRSPCTG